MAMLEVKDLEVYYGVICALKGISFEVNQGEIVTLIGANGGSDPRESGQGGFRRPRYYKNALPQDRAYGYDPGARGQTHFPGAYGL